MPILSLGLVLAAAVIHATWNLLAKQVGGGLGFVWLCAAASTVIWLPVAVIAAVVGGAGMPWRGWLLVAGSALIHIGYFLALQYGYRIGDLSVTYPLARGTAPLISTVGAILVLGERPTPVGTLGLLLLVSGVVALSFGGDLSTPKARAAARKAALVGAGVGAVIAVYTVWDAYAIKVVALSPILYDWYGELLRAVFLAIPATRFKPEISRIWSTQRRKVLLVGLLSPASYTLVLIALRTANVGQVAPLRECSVLFGVLAGARVLREGHVRRRLLAALTIFLGILALSL